MPCRCFSLGNFAYDKIDLPARHKSRVAVKPEYPAPTTIISHGPDVEMLDGGEITPIEGTP